MTSLIVFLSLGVIFIAAWLYFIGVFDKGPEIVYGTLKDFKENPYVRAAVAEEARRERAARILGR